MICSHFGDVGDILSAMASFHHFGEPVDLVLYPAPGKCREMMTPRKVALLEPLLKLQPYIKSVRYSDRPEGFILDDWRKLRWDGRNLADMFADFLKVERPAREKPWLVVDEPNEVAPVVIHRSGRYPGIRFPWKKIIEHYKDKLVMVGTVDEQYSFSRCYGYVPFYKTETYLDLARVIAGSKLFVGNQSCPYWIATGLMQRTWLEQYRSRRGNSYWSRPGAVYDYATLPEIS